MADNKIRYEISTDVEYNIRTNDFSLEHTHDYWEIVFVVSGRIFNCINGEVTAIEKNMAALIKPDDLHSIRVDGNSTMYYNLEIRKELFKEFLDTIDTELYEEVLSGKNLLGRFDEEFSENVKQFVTDMLRYGTVEEEKRGLKRLIFRLIFDLLPNFNEIMRSHFTRNDVIEKALGTMSMEENVRLKLSDICAIIGYSESYLIRLFRQKMNTTPNREFTKIKMRYAAKLLRKTDFSIERIALMVGYSSKGHFYKLFFAEYGMLPYNYKKMKN